MAKPYAIEISVLDTETMEEFVKDTARLVNYSIDQNAEEAVWSANYMAIKYDKLFKEKPEDGCPMCSHNTNEFSDKAYCVSCVWNIKKANNFNHK